jgi:hypothetical protein
MIIFIKNKYIMEIWKLIPSSNGVYEVSSLGNVRRVEGKVKNTTKSFRKVGGKLLSQKTKKNGYKEVSLYYLPQVSKMKYVHRLVAETFIGIIPELYEVNHKDGNKNNNTVDNLEIITPSENRIHSHNVLGNKIKTRQGIEHGMAKTTEAQVLEIRKIHSDGITPTNIALKFNKPFSSICKIIYRKTWKHL